MKDKIIWVVFFILLTLPMLRNVVNGDGPVFLRVCSKTTCKVIEKGSHQHTIATQTIGSVSDSAECPTSCAVVSGNRVQYHVVGNWLDISCQIWGGPVCKWKHEILSAEEIKQLIIKGGN